MAQMNLSTEKKLVPMENRLVVANGEWEKNGMDWEFWVNRCKLLPLEWISNGILLYSTRNYVWSLVMEHDNVRKKNVCVTGSPCCTVEN